MKKLSTLFAIATLATTLGLAGCKKKAADDTKAQPAAAEKTNEATPDQKAAPTPDQAKPADQAAAQPGQAATPDQAKPADQAAAPAATGDLPKECADYKTVIDKLSTCDKMPQATRDQLKKAYEQAEAGWANLAPEAKKNLSTSCKSAADAVMQSAKSTCGW